MLPRARGSLKIKRGSYEHDSHREASTEHHGPFLRLETIRQYQRAGHLEALRLDPAEREKEGTRVNWLMERINAIFKPHTHNWRAARKAEDQDYRYCRTCPERVAVKHRKPKGEQS